MELLLKLRLRFGFYILDCSLELFLDGGFAILVRLKIIQSRLTTGYSDRFC